MEEKRFCKKCGKEFLSTQYRHKGKKVWKEFCSRSCANSHIRTEESKEKTRQSVLNSKIHKKAVKDYRNSDRYKKVSEAMKKRWAEQPHSLGGLKLDISNKEMREYKENHIVCEICGEAESCKIGWETTGGRIRKLARDHQPETNHFRGLLCTRCNQSLGWYERFSKDILKYLERNIDLPDKHCGDAPLL